MQSYGAIVARALIGRAREMQVLDQALSQAAGGAGSLMILSGEAGIGKSRLVAESAANARRQGFTMIYGACTEQDRDYPYAPWVDALRAFLGGQDAAAVRALAGPLAPELVKLLPELSLALGEVSPTPRRRTALRTRCARPSCSCKEWTRPGALACRPRRTWPATSARATRRTRSPISSASA